MIEVVDNKEQSRKELLNKVGLKATPGRLAILQLFSSDCVPYTIEEIREATNELGIDKATIYRTITTFTDKGLIKKVDLRQSATTYELVDMNHHHHIICTKCGTIEGFEFCLADQIANQALKQSKKFKSINEHSLEFFGLCRACESKI